jgi:hypothetical protein
LRDRGVGQNPSALLDQNSIAELVPVGVKEEEAVVLPQVVQRHIKK